MPAPGQQPVDQWASKQILLEGGLVLKEDPLTQGMQKQGSLLQSVNFETSSLGGYRRVNGYVKYSTTAVTGTGQIFGVGILNTGAANYVIACRNTHVYSSVGTSWTQIDDNSRSTPGKAQFCRYAISSSKIVVVDGVNHPFTWDGTTWTKITASGDADAATSVAEFNTSIFYGKGNLLTWSVPGTETSFSSGSGAGQLNVADPIIGLITWQGALYVFCENAIRVLNGTSSANYTLSVITRQMGCFARDSIKELGGDVYFLSPFGIKSLSSLTKLIDVDLGSLSRQIASNVTTILTNYTADQVTAVAIHGKTQYRLFTSTNADTTSTAIGILGCPRIPSQINAQYFVTGTLPLDWHTTLGFVVACADSYVRTDDTELVVHGAFDGYIWQQEQGYLLAGTDTISSTLQTPYLIFADPAFRVAMQKLKIYAIQEATVTPTVQLTFDYNNAGVIQPSAFTSVDMTKVFDIGGVGYAVSFTITSNTSGDASFTIKSLNVQFQNTGTR